MPSLLPGVMVTRGDTPRLDHATGSLRDHMAGGDGQRGLAGLSTYLTADVTPEAVASFFRAAAALYARRPWQCVPSDGHLFQVSYGVILFESVADYERYVDLAERAEFEGPQVMDAGPPHRAINFEPKRAMPAALLQEIQRHRWPVAKGDAYPTVMLVQPDLVLAPPMRADLRQLEAVAGALTQWLDAEPDLARCWEAPSVRRRRFRVPVGGMEVPVTIGVATEALREGPSSPDEPPAELPGGRAWNASRPRLHGR